MAYKIVLPITADKICKVMHQIIYQNPINESEDIASLPVMLFGEVIESCHKIEELDNETQDKKAEKKKLLKSRRRKLDKLRSKLRKVIKGLGKKNIAIPKSIKGITKLSEKTLSSFDDKNSKAYEELKETYDEFIEVVNETEEVKIEYQNSLRELRKTCRTDGVILLRRTRDALKVNFLHLGKKEYYAQLKAHGFKLKKK